MKQLSVGVGERTAKFSDISNKIFAVQLLSSFELRHDVGLVLVLVLVLIIVLFVLGTIQMSA